MKASDRDRKVEERMSLKHKGTSRFMQKQTRYGKFNVVSRQAVQDMLQQSQTLRHKQLVSTDDTEQLDNNEYSSSDEHDTQTTIHETPHKTTQQDSSSEDEQTAGDVQDSEESDSASGKASEKLDINPSEYLVLESQQSVAGKDTEAKVALAFAGDEDVVAEFAAEKRLVTEREQPKDIDLRLPGWGEWSGPGVKPSQRRKKRFVIKAPAGRARKDAGLGHVIISESKDKAIAKHQVNCLPHPFHNVREFEKQIQQPIGRTWIGVSAFKKLTKPKIVTRLGKVISPIEKSEAFKKQKTKTNSSSERRHMKTAS